jgi:hypothetical protein
MTNTSPKSTGTLKIVPNLVAGYAPYDVCFWCTNGSQNIKRTITVKQKMECSEAFPTTGSVSKIEDKEFVYSSTGVETLYNNA